ncbi:MAG: cytochrome c, partial [Candidatus Eremiobacteraeota bacterium]|nr:cytochrome c [Candidatus Eremiobacteraeota bacterium]
SVAAAAKNTSAENAATENTAAGNPANGEKLYMSSCVACHGADAKGVPSLGKSLHPSDSAFVHEHSDADLVEFIKVGRQPGEPLNTTGVAMPPKGGNPAISDAELYDIVAWIRTLD